MDVITMAETKPFYITTAISYPNGPPHMGHAYEAIATDAIARFEKLSGRDVYFLTGTDEHGIKMLQTARKEGVRVEDLAEKNTARFEELVSRLGCGNDDFVKTREKRHHTAVQEVWRLMEAAGDIYLDSYSGWYSVRDEAFYDEDELTAQEDGVKLSPQGTPVEWVEEETYFFRLSKYQDRLLEHYKAHPDFILPKERRNEVVRFVEGGLRDLSVSRTTFDWGVSVPGDDKHVMYVWVDALTNYLTGVGYPDESNALWGNWPADLHVIGKDIVRFHAVYWPAFLMSARLALPKRVFAHGFLFNRGEKMSKSTGNVVDPFAMIDAYGLDQVRYFLLREVPFGKDGSYSHEAIVNRTNADLANDIGNLAQRSLSMIAKNCEGKVPQPGALTPQDLEILKEADGMFVAARAQMDVQSINRYLDCVWDVVANANRYFAGEEPWAKKKTDFQRMETILYVSAEVVRQLAILAQPVMPQSSSRLLDLLGVQVTERSFAALGEGCRLKSGVSLPTPEGVFPRYVEPTDEGGQQTKKNAGKGSKA